MQQTAKWGALVALSLLTAVAGCGDDDGDDVAREDAGDVGPEDAGGVDEDGGEEDDAGEGGELCYEPTLPASLCDPASATFSLDSTNEYYPLTPGLEVILEGEEDGELIRVERVVLDDTMMLTVDGVTVETHVLEATEYVDGEIYEVARNFYVEASDGTVCYFGEDVDFYEGGVVVNNEGSWRAGVDGALPGIIMAASPAVGDAYLQENAPEIAQDQGRVTETGASRTYAGETFTDAVVVMDINPLESCDPADEEEKVYAPGLGEVADTEKVLIEFTQP